MSSTAELVSLNTIVPPANHEVGSGFAALVEGENVHVRAVLERTVVVENLVSGDRRVVKKEFCLVEPEAISFIPGNVATGGGPRQWRRLPGKPPK